MVFRQQWRMRGLHGVLWIIHKIALNPWKCHFCGIRGASPMDFPDGSTLWRCHLGSCYEYWESDGEFRYAPTMNTGLGQMRS
jgi:hypothetical protein